jgi:hypothetical protein
MPRPTCFRFICLFSCLLGGIDAAGQTDSKSTFDFNSLVGGTWVNTPKAGENSVGETWQTTPEGAFMGSGFVVGTTEEEDSTTEILRIQPFAGTWLYLVAQLKDGRMDQPVCFVFNATLSGPKLWVFENAAHDFPKRIAYQWESGNQITAFIDDGIDATEDAVYFRYQRVER